MTKAEVHERIEEIGIIPAIRASSAEDAHFAAGAVSRGGIPIVEITMTVPGALDVITQLLKSTPEMIVGAGSILDVETARRCVDAGAQFLTTDGLVLKVVEFAVKEHIVVFPGVLTPSEVIEAWGAGSDFVKVVPCAAVGGDSYIRSLNAALPQVPLIAAGGVNQLTALNFILSGATALGVGRELIPKEAIRLRQSERIVELSRRFLSFVNNGRVQAAARRESIWPKQ
jgi:2-dehydro-3-deoxyphosphogluconate aldolase / (4S)-4-hydroxy-2-oxoglutarate aldolase